MLDVEELGIDKIAKEAADRANDNVDAVYISWDIDTFRSCICSWYRRT